MLRGEGASTIAGLTTPLVILAVAIFVGVASSIRGIAGQRHDAWYVLAQIRYWSLQSGV